MLHIREAIVVEGRYDKHTLSQVVDALIVETSGFGIFKDVKQLAFLRKLAEERGLIILTDSDGAGFVVPNFSRGASRQSGKARLYPGPVRQGAAQAPAGKRENWAWRGCVPRSWRRSCAGRALPFWRGTGGGAHRTAGHKSGPDAGWPHRGRRFGRAAPRPPADPGSARAPHRKRPCGGAQPAVWL